MLADLDAGAVERGGKPVFLKVAPDLDGEAVKDIVGVLGKQGSWLSGLIVSNTTIARPKTLNSAQAGEVGGLSGAPLFQASTDVLRKFAKALEGEFDLIGVGGVSGAEDAWGKLRAGADAVQLYSALVYQGPKLAQDINRGLLERIRHEGHADLEAALKALRA